MSREVRLALALTVLATLAVAVVAIALDANPVQQIAICLFMTVELGIAPWLLARPMTLTWFAILAFATGLSTTLTVGFAMALSHVWVPQLAFIVVAITTVALLCAAIRSDILRPSGPRPQARGAFSWRRVRFDNLSAGVGIAIIIVIAAINHGVPQSGGLLAMLGPTVFVGLAAIVLGAFLAFRAGKNGAFPVIALSSSVVLGQAVAYGSPVVMSAARHVGVIEFIRTNHGVTPSADIYQAWSGLFAGIAWVADVGNVANVMDIATWWPVLLSAATAVAVAALAGRWMTDSRRAWLAAGIFSLSSTLNIVYFSPQSVGLFLAIVIFAIVIEPRRVHPEAPATGRRVVVKRRRISDPLGWGRILLILYFSCVLAVTHQISPYLTVAGLVALLIFGYVRPWWIPLLVLIPAVAWALANTAVLGKFVSLEAIGHLFENVRPPQHPDAVLATPLVTKLAFELPAAVLVIVGIVALITVVVARSRTGWALAATAASAGTLLVATNYGQEGIFRATLFASIWLSVLAAGVQLPRISPRAFTGLAAGSLVVLIAVNAFGQTALDWNRAIPVDAAEATSKFEGQAKKGSLLMLTGTTNTIPLSISSKYPDVGYVSREGLGWPTEHGANYDATADVAELTHRLATEWPATEHYAVVSTPIGAYDERYGYQSFSDYQKLAKAMAASPAWTAIFTGPTTTLYRLTDLAAAKQG